MKTPYVFPLIFKMLLFALIRYSLLILVFVPIAHLITAFSELENFKDRIPFLMNLSSRTTIFFSIPLGNSYCQSEGTDTISSCYIKGMWFAEELFS